jgi:hypothetical protein
MDKTDDYKSRKLVLCVLVILLATAMLWFGKISADIFKAVTCFALGAYVLGNVGQKGLDWWLGGTSSTGSKTP